MERRRTRLGPETLIAASREDPLRLGEQTLRTVTSSLFSEREGGIVALAAKIVRARKGIEGVTEPLEWASTVFSP